MTKAEFLGSLRERLSGEVSEAEIQNTIRYYEEYISEAVRGGRAESEVLAELGSPLLIAKTIIDTTEEQPEQSGSAYYSQDSHEEPRMHGYTVDFSSWKARLIGAVIVIAVLALCFTVLRVLIPLLPILLLVWIILTMFRGGRGR